MASLIEAWKRKSSLPLAIQSLLLKGLLFGTAIREAGISGSTKAAK